MDGRGEVFIKKKEEKEEWEFGQMKIIEALKLGRSRYSKLLAHY
jgi:hypothetical protein